MFVLFGFSQSECEDTVTYSPIRLVLAGEDWKRNRSAGKVMDSKPANAMVRKNNKTEN